MLSFRRFKESASIGAMEESSRKGQVLGFMVACAHLVARRVRVDVAVVELHGAAEDEEAAALPGEMALAFGRFKESASIGAMGESSRKWQVLGFWWRARVLAHVLTLLAASFE